MSVTKRKMGTTVSRQTVYTNRTRTIETARPRDSTRLVVIRNKYIILVGENLKGRRHTINIDTYERIMLLKWI
jgi:hypothetical protein